MQQEEQEQQAVSLTISFIRYDPIEGTASFFQFSHFAFDQVLFH